MSTADRPGGHDRQEERGEMGGEGEGTKGCEWEGMGLLVGQLAGETRGTAGWVLETERKGQVGRGEVRGANTDYLDKDNQGRGRGGDRRGGRVWRGRLAAVLPFSALPVP